ncbi:MAG: hypothetical protein BWY69_00554 [Planctomycetes bacterium ADurb.Bin401]|nr:MAG: hypothetical protein BWY69_00554 [Planctomycetes bacterium ADurb.Bin401]
MYITCVFANSVIDKIVNQFDDRGLTCYFLEITNIFGNIFYNCEIIKSGFIYNIINYKYVRSGHIRLQSCLNIF